MKSFSLITSLLVLLFSAASHASAAQCELAFTKVAQEKPAKIRTFEASDSVSQYIRDNAPDYWRWSKANAKDYFGNLIKYEGIVLGDTHPGNFIFGPLDNKMKMFFMDLKDAGQGPFIVDIARFIMATNSIFKDGKEDLARSTERQLDAYIVGLKQGRMEPHDRIEWIFEQSKSDYNDEQEKYVDKHTVGSGFKLKDDMIEPLRDHIKDDATRKRVEADISKVISKSFPGAKAIDFAYRPRERGGSKNLKRYWVLVEKNKKKSIFEFKEIESPAVAQYENQLSAIERFQTVMKKIWGVSDPNYQAVLVDGEPFWMRPKKIDMFDIPYKQKDKDARKFVRHLAAYQAYLLGKYHGKQMKDQSYLKEVTKHESKIIDSINEMSDDYVDRLVKAVEKLQDNGSYD